MDESVFGKIRVVRGTNGGRFPFCNSLLIDDGVKAVIDPGAGPKAMMEIKGAVNVDMVINTHFHFDHISGNHFFDQAEILVNDIESECYRNREDIPKRLGMSDYYGEGWIPGWLERISRPDSPQSPYSPQNRHEWWLSTARIDGTYRWGDVLDFGTTKMEVIGAPGHSAGFCCLYFPGEGVAYTGDIDLTSFGPWYFGADGDIARFIQSAERIAELDAEVFVTGHEVGIVRSKDFRKAVRKYTALIDARDERILEALAEPLPLRDLHAKGLIYGRKFLIDQWVCAWDHLAVDKHLSRLLSQGRILYSDGKYRKT
ncbi:MAG: MBL fold metallo-hydrolase [Syntrophaceae bacterium]|nr:MBL fold metallo-hydrolase [Syntrophaceae bacterium]